MSQSENKKIKQKNQKREKEREKKKKTVRKDNSVRVFTVKKIYILPYLALYSEI